MYENSKNGLDEAQTHLMEAGETIRETNRNVLRNYLRAAFGLQRAGLEAIEALQRGAEELTFNLLDRAEEAQERTMEQAETRLRANVERLMEARERIQARLREERDDAEEAGDLAENRLREGAEIGVKVLKVLETRVETMLTELVNMGRRELNEIEDRIDAIVQRLDRELDEEIHPIPSYDAKNAEEITRSLDGLDEMQLRTVRAYEVNHKNRVTILRAIDEKLAQKDELGIILNRNETIVEKADEAVAGFVNPIARYDELTVGEVEQALDGLDAAELGVVRGYEIAHKNRVTLLRAIDEKLEARAQQAMPA